MHQYIITYGIYKVNSFNYLKIIFVHLAQNKAAAKGDSFKVIFI